MAEKTKAVLMVHTDRAQGELWQTALSSQQLDVTWQNTSLDLVQYLEKCDRQDLPDLMIMDMAVKSPSSESLQSSSVCQWLTKNKVSTKVVLFNPRQEKIKDIEHSWAIRRGASDVIPRLYSDNLITEVARVTALMGCTLEPIPLEKIARTLDSRTVTTQAKVLEPKPVESEPVSTTKKSQTKNNTRSNQNADESHVVMYRGVRIRR
ncbi:MAG: hypothetical protein AUK48_10810 [Oscillatoriales cyanobacterium CG2_30_44_21]|nr:MAG: hypothetical protein AUK48_10810 [Oscillatoriales cyanobacterium CG2_30_44_21]